MYLFHELRRVPAYRQTEAVERIHWLHSLMRSHPGFVRAVICHYLGNQSQYVWMRIWKSSADWAAFRQSPAWVDHNQQRVRPTGIYGPLPGGVGAGAEWEAVVESGVEDSGSYLVRSVYEVRQERTDQFLEEMRRYHAVALETPGVVSLRTFRCTDVGSDGLFMCLTRAVEREAYRDLLESPGAAEHRNSFPTALSEQLAEECYSIIDEVLP